MATNRSHRLQVRLTPDELAFLDRRARGEGMTRSAYARAILGGTTLGEHVVGKVETAPVGKQRGRTGIAVMLRPDQPHRRVLRAVPTDGG